MVSTPFPHEALACLPVALGAFEPPLARVRANGKRDQDAGAMTSRYQNQSIERVFRMLEVLGSSPYYFRLAEIARRCDLAPPTAFRQLSVLARLGYVNKDAATGRYGIGFRMYRLAHRETHLRSLTKLAQPRLLHLAGQTGETVHLAAFDGVQVVIRSRIAGTGASRLPTRVGMRLDAHATALGKAMLAFRPAPEAADIFMNHPLAAHTAATIRSFAALERDLAATRSRGFAIDQGEFLDELRCVAAPVRNSLGAANIAVSISAPAARLSGKRLERMGKLVSAAADSIEQSLFGAAERITAVR